MSYSKREFEKQDSSLEGRLASVRAGVETALRATEEGSLDMFTIDAVCISLHDALRHLSAVEDEASGQAGREESLDDERERLDREARDERDYDAFQDDNDDPDADERNW